MYYFSIGNDKLLIFLVIIFKSMYISKIKKLCNDRNTSLKDLANKIEISEQGLHGMLKNHTMQIKTLQSIADYFKVPVTYFFEDNKINENTKEQLLDELYMDFKKMILNKK
jgi:transcriptional regulator with XRE-family HTH domain